MCSNTLGPAIEPSFVDVADDKYRNALSLCQLHQGHGTVLHLPHAAGGRIHLFIIQRLDGVHDEHIRFFLPDTFHDIP